MAESNEEGSWWGGWLQAAKEKSASAIEFMKKDLTEFGNCVQEDAVLLATGVKEKLTQENAAAASKKMKDGMSSVFKGISKALTIPPDEADDQAVPITAPVYSRAKARLQAIQLDPETYLTEPPGPAAEFDAWKVDLNLDEKKGDISELLVANVQVRALYTQMVPSQVSHANFWHRYFYRVHQLQLDEARRAALMKRADVSQADQDLAWDEDEWGDGEEGSSSPKSSPSSSPEKTPTDPASSKQAASVSIPSATAASQPSSESSPASSPDTAPSAAASPPPQPAADENATKQVPGDSKTADTENSVKETVSHSEDNVLKKTEDLKICDAPEKSTAQPPGPSQNIAAPAVSLTASAASNTSEHEAISVTPASPNTSQAPSIVESQSSGKSISDMSVVSLSEVQSAGTLQEGAPGVQLKTKEKGDMVVVGTTTPTSSHSGSSTNGAKETTSLDEDWDDLDVEVTEEDIRMAQEAAKLLKEKGTREEQEDDWENWD